MNRPQPPTPSPGVWLAYMCIYGTWMVTRFVIGFTFTGWYRKPVLWALWMLSFSFVVFKKVSLGWAEWFVIAVIVFAWLAHYRPKLPKAVWNETTPNESNED